MAMSASVWALPPYTEGGPSIRPPAAMANPCHIPTPTSRCQGPSFTGCVLFKGSSLPPHSDQDWQGSGSWGQPACLRLPLPATLPAGLLQPGAAW